MTDWDRWMRICWPDPDATCLMGGCVHCGDQPLRSVASVKKWAASAGQVPNRYWHGTRDALSAFQYGRAGWRR